MALRPRRRQGGSPSGRGRPDPNRPNVATGAGTTRPQQPGPKKGLTPSGGAKPAVATPSATYVRRPAPAASAPIQGATSSALRANANSALGIAKTQNRDAIYRAIMQLGDPSQFAKYQADPNFAGMQFSQDPNSIFSSLARQEEQGLKDIDVGANVGNTFFSGMRLGDRQKLTDETGRQRLGATTSFGDDLKALAAQLGLAENDYRGAISEADQMDVDAALERDRVAREAWEAQEAENARVHGEQQTAAQQQQAAAAQYANQQRQAAAYAQAQARARAQQEAAQRAAREAAERARRRRR